MEITPKNVYWPKFPKPVAKVFYSHCEEESPGHNTKNKYIILTFNFVLLYLWNLLLPIWRPWILSSIIIGYDFKSILERILISL